MAKAMGGRAHATVRKGGMRGLERQTIADQTATIVASTVTTIKRSIPIMRETTSEAPAVNSASMME